MNTGTRIPNGQGFLLDIDDSPSGIRPIDHYERAQNADYDDKRNRIVLRGFQTSVILTILKWDNARPGVLSWEFDSIATAVGAAKAFRNALSWAVYSSQFSSFEAAKRAGDVLLTSESK
jgi:hypothetical protein